MANAVLIYGMQLSHLANHNIKKSSAIDDADARERDIYQLVAIIESYYRINSNNERTIHNIDQEIP